jgi:hypothetical protein
MQNKANFRKSQMNVTKEIAREYEKKDTWWSGKNKPNSKPIKANFRKAQMNVTIYITKDYENKSNWAICENKANTNPIQTQTKPISPAHKTTYDIPHTTYEIQTQSEILNQKSQIHSHPAGNKLHTPRRQSWGCFDLSGRATPKTIGLGFSLVALRYYSRTTDKI